jgi:SAM-dependent methyltransferase
MALSSSTATSRADRAWSGRRSEPAVAPEVELILRAVQVPSSGAPPVLAPDGEVDWARLVGFARAHGVLALVARALNDQQWDGVPSDVVQRLRAYRSALTARNVLLAHKLIEVMGFLAEHGIASLPYKGPVLAAFAYGDIGLRPFVDLDLILSERDVLRARSLLLADGYESLSPRTDSARPGSLPPGYAIAVRSRADDVVVELHWKFAHAFPLTVEHLLADTTSLPLLDAQVPCMGPEHVLLTSCVHGTKHAWERLEWVTGVGHLVGRCPELDWDRIVDEARELRADRAVSLGLGLAARMAGAPVPGEALDAMGASRGSVPSLATEIETRLVHGEPGTIGATTRYWLRLRGTTLAGGAKYIAFLQRASERDRAFVTLPRPLSFLYVLVRPGRMLYEHLPRSGDRGRRVGGDRSSGRALARQLEHQAEKAAALRGRDDAVIAALALRWDRVRRRIKRVKPELDDPRMLEVGSGAHGILFGSGSARAVGVDPLAAEYKRLFPAWQGAMPTIAASGEALPFGDGSFDVVVCDNVVDHAGRPPVILAELARVLAPGGILYFTVNVHHRLYSMVARAHRRWTAVGIPIEIGPFADHTFHFTPAQARDLFCGLPLEIRREHVYLDEAKVQARRRKFRHPGHLLPLVFFKNARYEVVAVRQ